MKETKYSIKHDAKSQKFFTIIGGKECSLRYDKIGEHILNFKMIYVPKNLRSQGIAGKIMEFAFAYLKKNMIKCKISCNYIDEFLNKNKEYVEFISSTEDMPLLEA